MSISRTRQGQRPSRINRGSAALLYHQPLIVSLACLAASAKLFSLGSLFGGTTVLMLIGFLYPLEVVGVVRRVDRVCQSYRLNVAVAASLLVAVFVGGAVFLGHSDPASAQFFIKTEQWLQTAIPGMDAKITSLIFNVLRLIFVIYLGVALVKVISAAQQGEDWQTLARTPAIVLVAVTLGDTLGSLITGNGGSSSTSTGK